ncbi:hypothetical protein FCL40_14710 [Ferrimonas sediminicola]|uniref:Uncharacterized protein n=1 Tax=Ferrimonas sediminicola TaxID=2569538 RepID=A0A4U1BCQ5_9GAMM|nr:hypothetical protein [Ferrimonas sediminicola]TKB47986.1 hypothetical protein FCL40_14710 [Ferrimonas sediminicola]
MNTDHIPTVKSLMEQHAIRLTGDEALRFKFSAFLQQKELRFQLESHPPYLVCFTGLEDQGLGYDIYFDEEKNSQPLYSIHFSQDISLVAHVRTTTGIIHKALYVKNGVNIARITQTFKALHRRLDQSSTFFVCQECHHLIDAELMHDADTPFCRDHNCNLTVKQPFDGLQHDRISDRQHSSVWAEKKDDCIQLLVTELTWPHPHECAYTSKVIKTLPLNTSPEEVRRIKYQLASSYEFFKECIHCNRRVEVGRMHNESTCQYCAESQFGVTY